MSHQLSKEQYSEIKHYMVTNNTFKEIWVVINRLIRKQRRTIVMTETMTQDVISTGWTTLFPDKSFLHLIEVRVYCIEPKTEWHIQYG